MAARLAATPECCMQTVTRLEGIETAYRPPGYDHLALMQTVTRLEGIETKMHGVL